MNAAEYKEKKTMALKKEKEYENKFLNRNKKILSESLEDELLRQSTKTGSGGFYLKKSNIYCLVKSDSIFKKYDKIAIEGLLYNFECQCISYLKSLLVEKGFRDEGHWYYPKNKEINID